MVEQVAHEQRGVGVRARDEVRDPVAVVHLRAAELERPDVLAHDLLHHGRAGEEHVRLLGHHDEVGQRGRIGAAARGGAADDGDLRHATRQRDVLAEDAAVARERGEALLHARAAGLDEADDGGARATGQAQHAHDRVRVLLAQRAPEVARVLRVTEDRAAVDAPGARDHAVAGAGLVAHPARAHVGAQQRQRAGVTERLEALERGELLVELGDELDRHAASRQSTALCPPNPNAFDRAIGRFPSISSGRAFPGT